MQPPPFEIPHPDADAVRQMEKAWSRADLTRYLVRWQNSVLPDLPPAFFDYPTRALDLGCGLGRYILRESARNPDTAYLGIDKGSFRGGSMQERIEKAGRLNLFGLHTNVIPMLPKFPAASLDQITIFYPNPWWPPKHRQKRWSYHPILPLLAKLIKPNGTLVIASNEAFYLGEFRYALAHHPHLGSMMETYAGPIDITEPEAGRTHFEVKFLETGVPCGELRFKKRHHNQN
ncbi:tRNA (guanine(46)-N(7))-methyltransferase TrmB [Acanthopleuribacter pedis]|uniref:tRNA (guanine(46)-N(7))-methyltransferase n=1 Tax=Acanthopleuribacter pedis TaxID=442870 RepID=A0A8J7U5Y4_9BACT|nr:hypothetical protein [Acanthopleuribacter pedis]MBO1321329.1 hypothetical protein [Acanthopleuribacter pedis]